MCSKHGAFKRCRRARCRFVHKQGDSFMFASNRKAVVAQYDRSTSNKDRPSDERRVTDLQSGAIFRFLVNKKS